MHKMIRKFKIFEKNEDVDPFGEDVWEEDVLYKFNVDVTIGKIIPTTKLINKYEMFISNMHGDADGYTNKRVIIDTEDKLKKTVEFITYMNTKELNRRDCDEICSEVGVDYHSFIEGDITADGQYLAMPEIRKILYHDSNGDVFNVNIKVRKII